MKSNDDQTITTENTEPDPIEVRGEESSATAGNDDSVNASSGIEERDDGRDITMGLTWSAGAGRQSSEFAVLAIRKIADVVLLLLISIAVAIAVTVTLIVGASWGWNFVWDAIRG